MSSSPSKRRNAFTLVELLVVIAIIGVLVSLLLPAVNAAREAARRTQCMNQTRQIGLAILNHEASFGLFPNGGIEPWPNIEDYSSNGKAFGPKRQGLSWAYQILPYLEEGAIHNLTTTEQIEQSPVSLYFCPSRRPPTVSRSFNAWLMDYASLTPAPMPPDIDAAIFQNLLQERLKTTRGCLQAFGFWGTSTYSNDFDPVPSGQLGNRYLGFGGIIVRSSYHVQHESGPNPPSSAITELNYDNVTSVRKVKDGLSKTGMVAEKFLLLNPSRYGELPYDDRGWSDGWDIDTVSLTICPPSQDLPPEPGQDRPIGYPDKTSWLMAGSAHTSGFNCVFGDGAVHFISFDVDLTTFNRIGNRRDGGVIGTDF